LLTCADTVAKNERRAKGKGKVDGGVQIRLQSEISVILGVKRGTREREREREEKEIERREVNRK
jgi:hypothetical protein